MGKYEQPYLEIDGICCIGIMILGNLRLIYTKDICVNWILISFLFICHLFRFIFPAASHFILPCHRGYDVGSTRLPLPR